jgi:hypothetical protein
VETAQRPPEPLDQNDDSGRAQDFVVSDKACHGMGRDEIGAGVFSFNVGSPIVVNYSAEQSACVVVEVRKRRSTYFEKVAAFDEFYIRNL